VFFYTNSTSPRSMDYLMANGTAATSYYGAAIEILGAAPSVSGLLTPTVTVTPSTSSITILQSLSVTVTVGSGSGNPTPTGTVTLTEGGYSSAPTTLSGGSVTVNIPAGSLAIGSNPLTVSYTPDAASSSTYNSATGTSPAVTVTQATPVVSAWPTASVITYGQTLASSTLTGGTASVPGAFAWTTLSIAPGAGTPSESVTFTPTDAIDYNTVTGSATVTVNKAIPTVTVWPAASNISAGQTLASSTLTGGTASVLGTFAWTTSATIPPVGTTAESVTFTPTDTTDYNAVTGSVAVTVNKATPTVSAWPTAGVITYGQTLASSTLTGGTASVPGTFAWTAPGTTPGAGTPSESVTFTPTDTTDYNAVTGSVAVTVTKATPTVSAWPAAGAITYGQTLASSTLTGGTASVPGAFAWTTASTAPGAGTATQSVTFTPSDATDYNTAAGQVSVTVKKATPTVSAWPAASAISYGQTLASSTLTGGTASVPGAFAWTAPGTTPGAGTPSESVTFTPTDTTDYNAVTGSVAVTVNKATPTVSAWPAASAINYGQTLASSTLTGGTASVPGAFAWTSASTAPAAGTPLESVTFTPTDATNYTTITHTVQLTVNKALLTVTATNASVPYNQAIPNLTYSTAGYVNGDTSSVLSGAPAETTTATQGSPVGTYLITITQGTLAAANYSFQFVNGTLTITASGNTAAPTVTTRAASNVRTNNATLNGTVTANNATTQYWFAYGTNSSSLTHTTTETGALKGTSATSVNASLTGLRASTTYYFQVVASNAVGITYGAVLSFTTRF
jgi:hypothetical protein